MTFMFGLVFASLCSCPFPPICVGGQRFMLKRRKDSVIFKLTEPIYILMKSIFKISDFTLLFLRAHICSVFCYWLMCLVLLCSISSNMLYINGKLTFCVLFDSLEYDENTSIIFRPSAKVMQCDLNLFSTSLSFRYKYGCVWCVSTV